MTTIPLADAKARLSAVLDEVRDTHERVVITRNGRPEVVLMAVSDLQALEETLDLLSTPDALEQINQAEVDIAAGDVIDAAELRRRLAARAERERRARGLLPALGRTGRTPGVARGTACRPAHGGPPPSLFDRPYVVGKPLTNELAAYHAARRGAYRVVYRIDEKTQSVRVLRIDHRADIYHSWSADEP